MSNLTFELLKTILEPYADELVVVKDTEDEYYLNYPENSKNGKPYFFASAKIRKNNVAFYFMPVYEYPELLEACSEELLKKLTGKSCFHFTKPDTELLAQLTQLVEEGFLHIDEHGHAV